MNDFILHISQHQAEIVKGFSETFFLLGISLLFAILVGLPVGTLIYLTRKDGPLENKFISVILNGYVNIVRSFPFLLLIVFLVPFTRWLMGVSLGTAAASVPMAVVSIAIYARFVEQALLDVPQDIVDTAQSLGANIYQLVFYFLFVEARSGLILGLTSSLISFVSYSTVMGVVGGGGIGDFAMRYGYQKYDYPLMYFTIILMIILVQLVQVLGSTIARKIDHR